MERYSRQECMEIAGIPLIITNDLLEGHALLIFSKIGVNIGNLI